MLPLKELISSYIQNTDINNPNWKNPFQAAALGKLIAKQWKDILEHIGDIEGNPLPDEGEAGSVLTKAHTDTNEVLWTNKSLIHIQGIASTKWIVTYTLPGYPTVTVVDTTGRSLLAGTKYISINELEINFANPTLGTALLKF